MQRPNSRSGSASEPFAQLPPRISERSAPDKAELNTFYQSVRSVAVETTDRCGRKITCIKKYQVWERGESAYQRDGRLPEKALGSVKISRDEISKGQKDNDGFIRVNKEEPQGFLRVRLNADGSAAEVQVWGVAGEQVISGCGAAGYRVAKLGWCSLPADKFQLEPLVQPEKPERTSPSPSDRPSASPSDRLPQELTRDPLQAYYRQLRCVPSQHTDACGRTCTSLKTMWVYEQGKDIAARGAAVPEKISPALVLSKEDILSATKGSDGYYQQHQEGGPYYRWKTDERGNLADVQIYAVEENKLYRSGTCCYEAATVGWISLGESNYRVDPSYDPAYDFKGSTPAKEEKLPQEKINNAPALAKDAVIETAGAGAAKTEPVVSEEPKVAAVEQASAKVEPEIRDEMTSWLNPEYARELKISLTESEIAKFEEARDKVLALRAKASSLEGDSEALKSLWEELFAIKNAISDEADDRLLSVFEGMEGRSGSSELSSCFRSMMERDSKDAGKRWLAGEAGAAYPVSYRCFNNVSYRLPESFRATNSEAVSEAALELYHEGVKDAPAVALISLSEAFGKQPLPFQYLPERTRDYLDGVVRNIEALLSNSTRSR